MSNHIAQTISYVKYNLSFCHNNVSLSLPVYFTQYAWRNAQNSTHNYSNGNGHGNVVKHDCFIQIQ